MREFVILGSSSTITPNPDHHSHHHRHFPKPKPKHSSSLHSNVLSPSKPMPAVHSRSPLLLSTVRRDLNTTSISGGSSPTTRNSHASVVSYYSNFASRLAEDGHLLDFSLIAESVISSGVESSHFLASLSVSSVARGISKNLREGNVRLVVQVLQNVETLGVSPLKLFDAAAMDLLKTECRRIAKSGDVAQFVDLMETLSGMRFTIKELAEPSHIIKICIEKQKPKLAVSYASLFPNKQILFCTIVKEFGRKRDLDSALIAYEESKMISNVHNMYLYRTIIDVCGLCGDYMKSRYIYEELVNQKISPNIYVFNSLMNVNANDLGYTLHIYKNMQNLGVKADMASYNVLLKACCLAGRVDMAKDIYQEVKQLEMMGQLKLDVFTYCTIIKIFADAKLWQMALQIKQDMLSAGVTPNTHTWSSLISACANAGLVEQAIKLFEEMIISGCQPNSQCCNSLLHACVEASQYDRAFRLFRSWRKDEVRGTFDGDDTCKEDNIEHTQSYSNNSVPNLVGTSLYLDFVKNFPFKPTTTTYNILMKACGTDYHRAKALMDEMKTVGVSPDHISWSILIDICGGLGNIEGAMQILKDMRMTRIRPDVITYTTAIKVCVESKHLTLAFSLFQEMKRYRIRPNLVTYHTLLGARTRFGSFQEVRQCLAIYQDMRKAGYKSNDYYLKQLIEEWCEGAIQCNYQSKEQGACHGRTNLGRPHSLILEKVAANLHRSAAESLAVDLRGLSKVEARIVVLAVLRMIKERHTSGQLVKEDMLITLGVAENEMHLAENQTDAKDAILQLLEDELGLEVSTALPGFRKFIKTILENSLRSGTCSAESLERSRKIASLTRRPTVLQRLKVTRNSLNNWLLRRIDDSRR